MIELSSLVSSPSRPSRAPLGTIPLAPSWGRSVSGLPLKVYTDDFEAYKGIEDEATKHETVNHSTEEYVRGDVHTNSVEGAFSLFKRSIVGAYHQVSAKHLPAYLDEFEFRFDNRNNPYLFRDTLLRLITSDHVTYQRLIA